MPSIRIQPKEQRGGLLPYPYFINRKNGLVGRQDFWKGKPYKLIGFSRKPVTGIVDLDFEEFAKKPNSAIAMYPVFEHKNGNMTTMMIPISSATFEK